MAKLRGGSDGAWLAGAVATVDTVEVPVCCGVKVLKNGFVFDERFGELEVAVTVLAVPAVCSSGARKGLCDAFTLVFVVVFVLVPALAAAVLADGAVDEAVDEAVVLAA